MNDVPAAFLETEINGSIQRYPLAAMCRVGRTDGNELVVPDESVSRTHAILHCGESGAYSIFDMGSSNGTFVNGVRVTTPVELRDGDRIALGSCEFRFQQPKPLIAVEPKHIDFGSTNVMLTQKRISVLVVDIRNFTGLAQRLDPSTLSLVAGSLFRESGLLLQARGAWGQKYIGDAVMAVWVHGTNPGPADMIKVLETACSLARIAGGLQAKFGLAEPIRVGCGINFGPASLGNLGSVGNADHTALGETVNRAFRLESATREINFDLLVGEGTYAFLEPVAAITAVFQPYTMTLKGYPQPITAYATNFPILEAALASGQSVTGSLPIQR
jgi:adenylate cyclase